MKQVILILGMHRSGTSALTRVVSLLGASLPKSILGKNESNLRGHWESEKLISAHDGFLKACGSDWKDWRRLALSRPNSLKSQRAREDFQALLESEYPNDGSVWLVKEPRICRFSQLYLQALKEDEASVHAVIMVRSPLEVAASLQARDEMNKLDGLYLWLTHMLEAELATRGNPRSFIGYDAFLKAPVEAAKTLQSEMAFTLPYKANDVKAQIEAYVNPSLKRHSCESEDIVLDPLARGWVSEAYDAFLVLCANPGAQEALDKLDEIRGAYFSALEPLHDILSHERSVFTQTVKSSVAELNSLHQSATERLEVQQKTTWAQRDAEFRQKWEARDSENLIAWRERDEAHAEAIDGLTKSHEAALAKLRSEYDLMITQGREAYEAKITEIQLARENDIVEQKSRYEAELTSQREDYDRQLAEQQSRYEAELKDRETHFEQRLTEVKAQYKAEFAQKDFHLQEVLAAKHEEFGAEISKQRAQHEAELSEERTRLQEKVESEKAELQDALMAKHEEFEAEISKQRAQHETELSKQRTLLQEKSENEKAELHDALTAKHEQLEAEISKQRAQHETEMSHQQVQFQAEAEKQRIQYEAELASRASQFEAKMADIKTQHQMEVDRLASEHQHVVRRIQNETSFMRDEFGEILRSSDARADYNASQVEALRREMSAVLNSTSWKMTSGIRRVMNLLKGKTGQTPTQHLSGPPEPPRLEFKPEE